MTIQKTIPAAAWIGIAALAFIWGGSFLSTRIALDDLGPLTVVLHRTGWAALVLWIWVWTRKIHVPMNLRFIGACLLMGLLNNVIPFGLMAWGQLYIETGLTAIFNSATAIFGILIAALAFPDERLTWNRTLGVLVGFIGVTTAIGWSSFANIDLRSLAQLAVVGGTLSYAIAAVWARQNLSHVAPEAAATGMLTASTVLMVPIVFFLEGVPTLNLKMDTIMAIAYFAIVATAVAYLLYYRVLSQAGSGNLSLVTLLVAPVAIVLGAVVLGEALPLRSYVGFVILAAGLILIDGRLFKSRKTA